MIEIPDRLGWWRGTPAGAEWLDRLPRLAAECAERWSLEPGDPFATGNVSLTLAAVCEGGTPAVLKLNFPERESEHEADALDLWAGRGAVRLLEVDRERNALLLERALPGEPLWEVTDDEQATRIAAGVLRRLWQAPPTDHPFRVLANEAEEWMRRLRRDWEELGRPFEEQIVEAGEDAARELSATQPGLVVCHQDLQGSNVLRAEREPWLAIDPKPIVGEPAFDGASLLRDRRSDVRAHVIRRRLDLLVDELGLDRERMRGWGVVHALYWGVGSEKVEPEMVECARILAAL
jgi:streptomycin 6-kinase